MRLYYYTSKQWGMKILWEKRLKIAEYETLNDPFELLPFVQTNKEARAHTKMVVQVLSKGHGVLCFSESWRSTLMWAHYGDKHTGICLGFEIKDGPELTKIEYSPIRLASPIDFNKPLGGVDEPMLTKCLNVKHSGWKYEKEHRLRVRLQEKRDGVYYKKFDADIELREIIIGARSSLSTEDISEAIGETSTSDIQIWRARAAHGSFKMCWDQEQPKKKISGFSEKQKKAKPLAEALKRK